MSNNSIYRYTIGDLYWRRYHLNWKDIEVAKANYLTLYVLNQGFKNKVYTLGLTQQMSNFVVVNLTNRLVQMRGTGEWMK